MQYQITGKHMDVGEALRTYVTDAMQAVVEKYAQRPTDANVVFSKRGHEFRCEATLHLSTGLTAQAHAAAHEVYGAFDQCCEKMEKQLRRYKRRLKDHHRDRAQPELGHQELELARLVPAGRHASAIVALDPDARPAQLF